MNKNQILFSSMLIAFCQWANAQQPMPQVVNPAPIPTTPNVIQQPPVVIEQQPNVVVPPGVVYVSPAYPMPAPGYVWTYHAHFGWGWYHPLHGWHRGWR